jgi:3-hydroxybutyryl-CoA dehydrogenase
MAQPAFTAAAVVGAGTMGPGIAMTLALGGVCTRLLDVTDEKAAKGLETARSHLRLIGDNDLADPERVRRAFGLLQAGRDLEATVRSADLVVESVTEEMALKQDLFARLDAIARPEAVLASNTSGLSITAIASQCRRPERTLTTHFWNPAHLMPLVEVVQGDRTSDAVAEGMVEFLAACGKTPVLVRKDRPGQLGNRLHMALLREAVNIVGEGIATVQDVDRALKNGFGLRLPVYGVFEHADLVGLDLTHTVLDYTAPDLYSGPESPPLLKELLARGELGAKSGRGFYDWSRKSAGEVAARRDRFVLEFLRSHQGETV